MFNSENTVRIIKALVLSVFSVLMATACGNDDNDIPIIPTEEFEFVPMEPLELNSFSIGDDGTVYREQEVGSSSQKQFDRSFDSKINSNFVDDTVNKSRSIQAYGNNFEASEDSADVNFEMYTPKSVANLDSKDSIVAKSSPEPATYHRRVNLKDTTTQKDIRYSIEYLPVNLSMQNVDKGKLLENTPYEEGDDPDFKQFKYFSIHTILSDLDKIPVSVTFPNGAICYEEGMHTASDPLFLRNSGSYKSSVLTETSLVDWEAKKVTEHGDYDSATNMTVGRDNAYAARLLNFSYKYASAISFGNSVNEEVRYISTSGVRFKEISTPEKVTGRDCKIFNDVAADFIEQQIVKYYE